MKYPDIYLVGAPKCGTTSLQYYLGQHPAIFAPEFKEPHFHTVALTGWPQWGVQSEEEYLNLYRDALPGQRWIDASAWNLYVPEVAQCIQATSPEAHIIISLRHPVKRAYSHFMHMVQRGWEKYYSFQEAIDNEAERIGVGAFWDVYYLTVGYYAQQVQRYFDVFPRERIKVLIFEEWTQHPEATVKEVLNFLGLDNSLSLQEKAARNVTQISSDQVLRMKLQKAQRLKNVARALLPAGFKRQIMDWLKGQPATQIPPLDAATLEHLAQHYREDVQTLEATLGYGIPAWAMGNPETNLFASAIANTPTPH